MEPCQLAHNNITNNRTLVLYLFLFEKKIYIYIVCNMPILTWSLNLSPASEKPYLMMHKSLEKDQSRCL